MRPKMSVSSTKATMTTTFRANTAGRNWMRAVHPKKWCNVPLASRNNSVTISIMMVASVMRIFLNIFKKI